MMTKLDKLVQVRGNEEIREHGSIHSAISAIERQISSPDSIPAERRFMRRVLAHLQTREVNGEY